MSSTPFVELEPVAQQIVKLTVASDLCARSHSKDCLACANRLLLIKLYQARQQIQEANWPWPDRKP